MFFTSLPSWTANFKQNKIFYVKASNFHRPDKTEEEPQPLQKQLILACYQEHGQNKSKGVIVIVATLFRTHLCYFVETKMLKKFCFYPNLLSLSNIDVLYFHSFFLRKKTNILFWRNKNYQKRLSSKRKKIVLRQYNISLCSHFRPQA